MRYNALWFIVAVWVSVGCASDSALEGIAPGCDNSGDCPSTQVCKQGLCSVPETMPRMLGFVLEPPLQSAFPSQSVAIGEVDVDQGIEILLSSGVLVQGTVTFANRPSIGPPGSLSFKLASGSGETIQTRVEQPEGYRVTLAAGKYDVTFVPDDAGVPSKVWLGLDLTRNTDPKFSLPSTFTRVTGSVSRVNASTNNVELVSGAQVFAVSDETGSISTIGTTSESGFFDIAVLPNSGTYSLRIGPSPEQNLIPNVTADAVFIAEDNGWRPIGDQGDLLAVTIGTYTAPNTERRFVLRSTDSIVSDWSGTRVVLETHAGSGTVRTTTDVASSGEVTIPDFQSEMVATILPPNESPAARTKFTIGTDSEWLVPTKHRLTGMIETWEGVPLNDAVIEATPDDPTFSTVTTSVENAEYELWLDDTRYTVAVRPRDASLPEHSFVIDPELSAESTQDVEIREPAVVWGTVLAAVGEGLEPVPDVVVRAIERTEGVERRIATGTTAADGQFRIVLPAR